MSYINALYYQAYTGDSDTPVAELEALIKRAEDIIDQITQHRIKPFEKWNSPTQGQIKKATVALVEYAVENGGLDVFVNGATTYGGSVRIGSFGYGDGRIKQDSGSGSSDSRVPLAVYEYLLPTGLLDAGMGGVVCG